VVTKVSAQFDGRVLANLGLPREIRCRYAVEKGRTFMNPTRAISGIPEEVKAELRQTLEDLVKGIRRPDKMKAARERMDRMRAQNRKLFGEQNIAVDLIREARDRP
jgi:hypothetical protein